MMEDIQKVSDTLLTESEIIEMINHIGKENKKEILDLFESITPEQAQQIAQGLNDGSVKEEELKQAYDKGELDDNDIQMIQQAMEGGGDVDEMSPEEKEKYFEKEIDQLTDNFVKLGLFDKINDLRDKINIFIESYNNAKSKLIDQFKLIRNYLDILNSLVYNLDVNLVYQLLITLEIKAIDLLREEMGYGPDKTVQEFFEKLEEDIQRKEIELKYSPENIVEGLASGEITEEDLKQVIELGLYSEEEIQEMVEQAKELMQQQSEQEQRETPEEGSLETEGEQSEDDPDKQAQEAAQAVINGELDANELIQSFTSGEITKEEFEKIILYIEQLKEAQSGQDSQSQETNQEAPQQEDEKAEESSDKPKKKKNQEVNSDDL